MAGDPLYFCFSQILREMVRSLVVSIFSVVFFSANAQHAWSLEECIAYANKNNIQVKQMQVQVERARIDRRQSDYNFLPDLNAYASHGYNWGQSIDPFTNTFATERVRTNNLYLNGSWTLFSGMSRLHSRKGSRYTLENQQKQLETLQNDISMQLTNAYLTILFNTELLAVAEQEVELSQAQLTRIEKLVDAGSVAKGDMFDIRSQLALEQVDVVNFNNQLDISYLTLIQLLQLTGDSAKDFRIQHPDLIGADVVQPETAYIDVYSKALETQPQIAGAELQVKAMESFADASKGRMIPSIAVNSSVGSGYSGRNTAPVGEPTLGEPQEIGVTSGGELVYAPTFNQEFETKKFSDQLGDNLNEQMTISLNVPIFNRLQTRHNYQKAKLDVITAQNDLKAAQDQLRTDVQNAYADMTAAYNRYLASEEAVIALEESYKYAEKRFENNAINSFDFNQIKTRLNAGRADLARAKYEFIFNSKIVDFYQGVPITLH